MITLGEGVTWSNTVDEFKKLVAAERELERRRKSAERAEGTRSSLEDRRALRAARRARILDACVSGRLCPGCEQTVSDPRRWHFETVKFHGESALRLRCIACFTSRTRRESIPEAEREQPLMVTRPDVLRFCVRPAMLRAARERTGLSVRELARRCGWSRSYQNRLESGGVDSITHETRNLLVGMLKQAGAVLSDEEWRVESTGRLQPGAQLHRQLVDLTRPLTEQLRKSEQEKP